MEIWFPLRVFEFLYFFIIFQWVTMGLDGRMGVALWCHIC